MLFAATTLAVLVWFVSRSLLSMQCPIGLLILDLSDLNCCNTSARLESVGLRLLYISSFEMRWRRGVPIALNILSAILEVPLPLQCNSTVLEDVSLIS